MTRELIYLVLIVAVLCGCATVPGQSENTLNLVSYNIKHGRGMDGEVDLDRIAAVLRSMDPDLVALQEIDIDCTRSGNVDTAAVLGKLLQMEHRFGKFMEFQGGEYGMAVLSRFPVRESRCHPLPEGAEPRCALEVVVEPPGLERPLSFISIHHDWTDEEFRIQQVKALIEALDSHRLPVILAGDFNAQRGAESIRLLQEAGWRVDEKRGAATFPADGPEVEIDFFMVRGLRGLDHFATDVLDERVASDHRPIHTVISIQPATGTDAER